ncbi:MAG: ATP-binding cassette domain-containing protein [Candidatus Altiarchaeota archaeon]
MAIIEIENLTKIYNGLIAVNSINLNVDKGEIFGLLGPNGAGKTTTLLMLATLIKPTSGTAKINGFDILKQASEVRKSIGIVFQDPSSDDILTGYENLKLHGMLYNIPNNLIEKRIEEVLELVELTNRKNDLVKKYSSGMRRRLEIARGLMHHPKILFLDEPTIGLDPRSREHIWRYIEKLVEEEKITIIITTHYMEEADRLCDRVAIMDYGKVVVFNTPEKLKKSLSGDIVKLRADSIDMELLKNLSYVKSISKFNSEISLTVENANEHLQEILKFTGEVKSIEIHPATLDDVFLHYTGRTIEDEPAEGGFGKRVLTARARK